MNPVDFTFGQRLVGAAGKRRQWLLVPGVVLALLDPGRPPAAAPPARCRCHLRRHVASL
jgi:hypothetical protein